MNEVEDAEKAHEPVEAFQTVMVQVLAREPWVVISSPSYSIDYGDYS